MEIIKSILLIVKKKIFKNKNQDHVLLGVNKNYLNKIYNLIMNTNFVI